MSAHHSSDDDEREEVTEQTPLVQKDNDKALSSSRRRPLRPRAVSSVASVAGSIHLPKAHSSNTVLAIFFVVVFIITCSNGLQSIPTMRVLEDMICQQYYGRLQSLDDPIDEELCKVDAIQSKLASVLAVSSALDAVVSCLTAMPWGFVADRIGRRPVMALGLIASASSILWQMVVAWFHLPIELVWLSSTAAIFGGSALYSALLASMISDILPENERALGFMRIHVASMIGNLGSPTAASVLMPVIGPWRLMFMAIGCLVVSAVAFFFIPETLQHKSAIVETEGPATFKARVSQSFAELKDSFSMLKSVSFVLLVLSNLSYMPVILSTLGFLSQFASKRYHIRLADTGYIQSSYGLAHVVVVLLVVPYLSHLVMKPTSPGLIRIADGGKRDLIFARWSHVALALGALIMGLSPALPGFIGGIIVMSLGSGASSFIRSTMSLYVGPEHRTRMFSLVGIVEFGGGLYAMPALAGLFTLGMRLGGMWMGLPYFGIMVLCIIVTIVLLFVRLPSDTGGMDDDEESIHSDSGTVDEESGH